MSGSNCVQTASWRTAGKPASTVEVGSDVLFTVERSDPLILRQILSEQHAKLPFPPIIGSKSTTTEAAIFAFHLVLF